MPQDQQHSAGASPPRFKGQAIEVDGVTYIVPPLALGAVQDLLPRIEAIGAPPSSSVGLTKEQVDTMLDVILAAMRRNYPELTRATLEEIVDLGNVKPLFRMVLGLSGFEQSDAASLGNGSAGPATP
ncbi:MAG: hypothetical protein ACHQWU_13410 [Gemmatimonadales bacterium]